ncbi:MAG: YHYH protein, partial [Bacteroidota bacterium]
TEIGRLIDAIPKEQMDNTVIIFIGDNGSPNKVAQAYGRRKVKGSLYQGGVNVPLVVSGKNVSRRGEIEEALVNSTDLFATISELCGTGVSAIYDSKSIVPMLTKDQNKHKDFLYSELKKKKVSGYAIRDARYKYHAYAAGGEELYDLEKDPYETTNLIQDPEHQSIREALAAEAVRMQSQTHAAHGHGHGSDQGHSHGHTAGNGNFSVIGGLECTVDLPQRNQVDITESNGFRIVRSNGIPNHSVGTFPNRRNPHAISEQQLEYRFTANPKKASRMTSIYDGNGFGVGRPAYIFGVIKNGVKLDPSAGEAFTAPGSREKNFDWPKEALSGDNRLGDDCNNAHVQPDGAYHYHGTPWGFVESAKGDAMFHAGWAADGFPIYYKWIPKDPNNPAGELIVARPSYRLRAGTRSGDGRRAPDGAYDGTYVRDFEYVAGAGDLDAANGRFGKTPEYPDGIYYYVITDDFPSVPRYFVGTPDGSFQVRLGPPPGGPGGHDGPGGRPGFPGPPPGGPPPQGGPPPPPGGSHGPGGHRPPDGNDRAQRFKSMDANKDGKLSRSEAKRIVLERFDLLDRNKDGFVSEEEFLRK